MNNSNILIVVLNDFKSVSKKFSKNLHCETLSINLELWDLCRPRTWPILVVHSRPTKQQIKFKLVTEATFQDFLYSYLHEVVPRYVTYLHVCDHSIWFGITNSRTYVQCHYDITAKFSSRLCYDLRNILVY